MKIDKGKFGINLNDFEKHNYTNIKGNLEYILSEAKSGFEVSLGAEPDPKDDQDI